MISWILGLIIAIWCLVKRFFKEGGRVSGYPLGMPRGTVRAYIAIIVVAFPFNYLVVNQEIPRVITSAIFILVAFYFETRKTKREKLSILIHEVKHPEEAEEVSHGNLQDHGGQKDDQSGFDRRVFQQYERELRPLRTLRRRAGIPHRGLPRET